MKFQEIFAWYFLSLVAREANAGYYYNGKGYYYGKGEQNPNKPHATYKKRLMGRKGKGEYLEAAQSPAFPLAESLRSRITDSPMIGRTPTAVPRATPTFAPTFAPAIVDIPIRPTIVPTLGRQFPTATPNAATTAAPTNSPTVSPTEISTVSSTTIAPSSTPTSSPSAPFTESPVNVTFSPTVVRASFTTLPTQEPTPEPSAELTAPNPEIQPEPFFLEFDIFSNEPLNLSAGDIETLQAATEAYYLSVFENFYFNDPFHNINNVSLAILNEKQEFEEDNNTMYLQLQFDPLLILAEGSLGIKKSEAQAIMDASMDEGDAERYILDYVRPVGEAFQNTRDVLYQVIEEEAPTTVDAQGATGVASGQQLPLALFSLEYNTNGDANEAPVSPATEDIQQLRVATEEFYLSKFNNAFADDPDIEVENLEVTVQEETIDQFLANNENFAAEGIMMDLQIQFEPVLILTETSKPVSLDEAQVIMEMSDDEITRYIADFVHPTGDVFRRTTHVTYHKIE